MPVADINLTCLIAGKSSPFKVMLKENKDIMDLRKLIKEEGIDPRTYILSENSKLWKVRMIMGQRQHN